MGKKGQQMTLGTIIAIVLGIAVLVFLIFGFSTGWNNMWSKITEFGGGESNVDTIVQACSLACSTSSEYGFCNQKRELNNGEGVQGSYSCDIWASEGRFGIKGCPGLCPRAAQAPSASGEGDW